MDFSKLRTWAVAASTEAANHTIALPQRPVSGSLLVAIVNSSAIISDIAGWTREGGVTDSMDVACYSRTANGGEEALEITLSAARGVVAHVYEFPAEVTDGTVTVNGTSGLVLPAVGISQDAFVIAAIASFSATLVDVQFDRWPLLLRKTAEMTVQYPTYEDFYLGSAIQAPLSSWNGSPVVDMGMSLIQTLSIAVGYKQVGVPLYSVFSDDFSGAATNEDYALSVGLKFGVSQPGFRLEQAKYWRQNGSPAPGQATLYEVTSGTELASTTAFTGLLGWVAADFPTPVPLEVGKEYTLAIFLPQGRYALKPNVFDYDAAVGPLIFPGGVNNNLFDYVGVPVMPRENFLSSSYGVDLVVGPMFQEVTALLGATMPMIPHMKGSDGTLSAVSLLRRR